jgi:hypothetical protein
MIDGVYQTRATPAIALFVFSCCSCQACTVWVFQKMGKKPGAVKALQHRAVSALNRLIVA